MLIAAGLTDINVALVVWTAVTFALLIVVLGKFAWGPILQMLEMREKTISDAIESAKRERAEAEKAAKEMMAALEKARAEAAELVRRNQQEVAAAKAELMAQARKESEDLLKQARATIEEERRAAVAELRSQVVDLAIEAAGRLLATQMDEKKQRQLVEEYLEKLPKEARVTLRPRRRPGEGFPPLAPPVASKPSTAEMRAAKSGGTPPPAPPARLQMVGGLAALMRRPSPPNFL